MHFLQRCWQRRWIRGIAWTLFTLITLVALLTAWMNWSGARQWKATLAMIHAEGETVDFRATMNDPIPEAENYCAIPLLKDLALVVDGDVTKGEPAQKRKRLEALKISAQGKGETTGHPNLGSLALGRRTDFKKWADWLREKEALPAGTGSGDAARDVLAALSKHDAVYQELAGGLSRPKAQWTPEWKTRVFPRLLPSIALPQYASLIGMNQTLALRAVAAAHVGDVATAHETAQIIARLNEASVNDPFLIGLLVGVSGTNTLCNLTWELCAGHAGTAEDFTRLESTLAHCDFHRATLHAFRSELAADVDTIQFIKNDRDNAVELLTDADPMNGRKTGPRAFLLRAIASGFFDANTAVFADNEFRYVVKPLRDEGLLGAQRSGLVWDHELNRMVKQRWTHPSYMMASLIAPATSQVINRMVYCQALVDQAIVGCALERYHLEHGAYPDSLDPVRLADGQPLPRDVMNGQPMGYRKTTDGRYALWSVGFDGKDDGGKRGLDAEHPEKTRPQNANYVGDWVWDFPAE